MYYKNDRYINRLTFTLYVLLKSAPKLTEIQITGQKCNKSLFGHNFGNLLQTETKVFVFAYSWLQIVKTLLSNMSTKRAI